MLEQAIKEVWEREMTTEYCWSLLESMPKPLEAVIKARVVQQNIEFLYKFDVNMCYISSKNICCLQHVLVVPFIFTFLQLQTQCVKKSKFWRWSYTFGHDCSTADKISFVSDNTETIADSANLEIQGQQLKKTEETLNWLETTVEEIARLANENEKAIHDLE